MALIRCDFIEDDFAVVEGMLSPYRDYLKKDLKKCLTEGSIQKPFDEHVTYQDVLNGNKEAIWSILVLYGLLNVERNELSRHNLYKLTVPNISHGFYLTKLILRWEGRVLTPEQVTAGDYSIVPEDPDNVLKFIDALKKAKAKFTGSSSSASSTASSNKKASSSTLATPSSSSSLVSSRIAASSALSTTSVPALTYSTAASEVTSSIGDSKSSQSPVDSASKSSSSSVSSFSGALSALSVTASASAKTASPASRTSVSAVSSTSSSSTSSISKRGVSSSKQTVSVAKKDDSDKNFGSTFSGLRGAFK